ncbi:MAG: cytochrome c biogenesis protein CcsA [Bacteroidales bacterium]|nr:cytochrome c biogenesis protein CcsA [Bacteroidales bacterium]
MLKRLSFFVSMPFMGVLLILLIVVLALATFVESAYNTQTAWAVAYGTHWFEILLLLIGINVAGVMIRYKFYKRRKITVLVFHLAFILIFAGAAITRFFSYEGNMHIRENATSNSMLSNNAYMQVTLKSGGETVEHSREMMLSELTPRNYRMRTRIGGEKVKIKSTGYMPDVVEQYVAAPDGEPYLQLMLVTDRQTSVGIPSGSTIKAMGMDIAFNNDDTTAVLRFVSEGNEIHAFALFTISTMQMGGETNKDYLPGEPVPIRESTLYTLGHMRMALQNYLPSARKQLVKAPASQKGSHLAAVKLELNYRGMTSELYVPGLARLTGTPVTGEMSDLAYTITYGSREIPIPFSLFLKDFEVERYPGSNSPSSFASEVVLIDNELGIREDRRIFMNNVLKHRGYRFYQASYDNDELGTVLSVNKDRAGTFVTYLGYLVLIAGMVLAMFVPGTRFAMIAKKTSMVVKSAIVALLILGGSLPVFSQEVPPKDVAEEFGYLWVLDKGGRFEPMNTLSNEVVRKITNKSRYRDYTPDQVLLGMMLYPDVWKQAPLFKVKHPELHRLIGFKGELVSFNDLMDSSGNTYLLSELVNEAYSKQVALQTDLDKEVIKLDDRVNALFLVQSGGLIRIFPDPGAENHRWASVSEALMGEMKAETDTMGTVFLKYLHAIRNSDYASGQANLALLHNNQLSVENPIPSALKKRMEIVYNRINIFPRLVGFYGIFGLVLMVLQFLIVFRPNRVFRWFFRVGVIHLVAAFVVHTLALTVRWYISGHAPMSNGYESMIFVSWVTLLAGLIFVKRSGYAMALTAILAALALMVAQMSNMNPEITNLVPVLKSPWLTIHVTVIMAGYGFLGLASIMGLLNVVLYALLTPKNNVGMQEVIQQVTRVNQLTLIVGLYFMTAGVFLGGVWANESWGRYWGWDPKETWALITVLVYAFVTHMHRIPGLRGVFAFNLASFISYASVLMTYFGVNYFLGGIHSYASGSSFKMPWVVYVVLVLLSGLAIFAYNRQGKLDINKELR